MRAVCAVSLEAISVSPDENLILADNAGKNSAVGHLLDFGPLSQIEAFVALTVTHRASPMAGRPWRNCKRRSGIMKESLRYHFDAPSALAGRCRNKNAAGNVKFPASRIQDGLGYKDRKAMDITTLLIIVVIVLLLGGGGFYCRGRWW